MKKVKFLLVVLTVICSLFTFVACGEGVRIHESIDLQQGEGYTLVGEKEVEVGSDYEFVFTLLEGYEKGSDFKVLVNGEAKEVAEDGKVIIPNVQTSIVVSVEGVQRISNAVTLTEGAGYTLTGESSVIYGDDYTFTFALLEGYKVNGDFAVKVNGEAIELTDGTAIVEDVKGALEITVEGVEKITYAVTLTEGVGYTLIGAESVAHGDDYILTFSFAEGYNAGAGFSIKVNGEAVEYAEGTAIIEDVKGALEITVEGVEKITYAVTLTEGVGYTLIGAESVAHGDDYILTFSFAEGYNAGAGFSIKVNGEAVEYAEGTAIIEDVKGALEITVEGVEKIVLNVTFAGDHVSLNGESNILYADDYSFMIEFESGYEKGADFMVLVNGVEVTANAEGRYVIEDVKENIAITVSGVALKKSAILEENEFENADAWWL